MDERPRQYASQPPCPPWSRSTQPRGSWWGRCRRSRPSRSQAVVDDVARVAAGLGRAAAEDARRLHAPRRPRAARRHRRDRRAAGPRAGQAAGRGLHDGAAADRRRPALVREGRPEDPRRGEGADGAGLPLSKKGHFSYEPIGVGRGDRALELPLVDPLRRGRDRADGRQRRRPQAGQPDAAAGRADRAGCSRRAGCPRG